MKNKDEALTKKELTALCKKQEEYIKELEDKLKTHSDTISCEPAKPDYDELYRQSQKLNEKIIKLKEENRALRYSLTEMYMDLKEAQSMFEMVEEEYDKEHKRANKLLEELENENVN